MLRAPSLKPHFPQATYSIPKIQPMAQANALQALILGEPVVFAVVLMAFHKIFICVVLIEAQNYSEEFFALTVQISSGTLFFCSPCILSGSCIPQE